MYKPNLALNNQQWLIYHKTKPNQNEDVRKHHLIFSNESVAICSDKLEYFNLKTFYRKYPYLNPFLINLLKLFTRGYPMYNSLLQEMLLTKRTSTIFCTTIGLIMCFIFYIMFCCFFRDWNLVKIGKVSLPHSIYCWESSSTRRRNYRCRGSAGGGRDGRGGNQQNRGTTLRPSVR